MSLYSTFPVQITMWFLSPEWTLTDIVTHSFKEPFTILEFLELNSASLPANHCLLQTLTQQLFVECHSQTRHWGEQETPCFWKFTSKWSLQLFLLSVALLGSMLLVLSHPFGSSTLPPGLAPTTAHWGPVTGHTLPSAVLSTLLH